MLWVMLLRVIWVHPMCHVCREHETPAHRPVVVREIVLLAQAFVHPLGDLCGQVGVSTLGRRRADLFMVEEHDHVDILCC